MGFELYSVPAPDVPIVSMLLALKRCKRLDQRRGLIAELDVDGWSVRFANGSYSAVRGEERASVPPRLCHLCKKWKSLDVFISVRGVEHPCCAECRFGRYAEAERARADLAYRVQHHQSYDDLLGIKRCKNPACPRGGIIPHALLRHGYVYCSPECKAAVQAEYAASLHPCANPGCSQGAMLPPGREYCSLACQKAATWHGCHNAACPRPEKLLPPGRKYCSSACVVEAQMASGHFRRASEKAVQRIADHMAVHGEMPHARERSQVVSRSNQEAPPRLKMEREDVVYGYLVRFLPDGEGGYAAQVDGVPTIEVRARTKKEARRMVAVELRRRERDGVL